MVMVKRNKMGTAANLSGSVDTISDGRDPMEANDNDEEECDFGDEGDTAATVPYHILGVEIRLA